VNLRSESFPAEALAGGQRRSQNYKILRVLRTCAVFTILGILLWWAGFLAGKIKIQIVVFNRIYQ
jgi:hypothetical protein